MVSFLAKITILPLLYLISITAWSQPAAEKYRPLFHFSPRQHWMNDPNGLVYFQGTYHMFYQYYPGGTTWGPMHWGHATSKDLVTWQHQPVALYPDSLGYIFSGSVVVDTDNTSGLAGKGETPLVAIFTHHNPDKEKAGRIDYQNQSLAYSLDAGTTWIKYKGNPVLKNPGVNDFRDPKVFWYAPVKKWMMTLATKDRISFYSSPNLIDWSLESQFGKGLNDNGVWECPDLFPLPYGNDSIWGLLVSMNPGGVNGGSGTMYFTGTFDGKTFTPFDTQLRWLDYGPDDYAGVTFSNTGNKKIVIGWMSNWLYAQTVPTESWRSAMTIPRELYAFRKNDQYFIGAKPLPGIETLVDKDKKVVLTPDRITKAPTSTYQLSLSGGVHDCSFILKNNKQQEIKVGYDAATKRYYIDRTKAGNTTFSADFPKVFYAPRQSDNKDITISAYVDVASIELFFDDGAAVMTAIFFPDEPYSNITVNGLKGVALPIRREY